MSTPLPINLFAFRTYAAAADPSTTPFNTYSNFHTDWFWLTYAEGLDDYYAKLLIIQYRGMPKAYRTVQGMVQPVVMDFLPLQVQNAFNLSTAVGVQLDVLGKYQGVTRSGYAFNQYVTLDDVDFLTLIQIAIIQNNAGSSLATIQRLLNQYFAGEIYLFDYANMNMSYLINESIGSENLLGLFISEKLLPKPMGVGLSVIAAPIINKFFGLRNYLAAASPLTTPLNSYTSYQNSWLFMTYADALVV